MAKNAPAGDNRRRGSVRDRTQFQHNGVWFKRDARTGQILGGKTTGPYKGVAREPDGRRS
jgi:hypothetical protein